MENNNGRYAPARKKKKGGRYAAAKSKPQVKKKFSWKYLLFLLIPAAAIGIAAAVVLMAVDQGSTYEFTDNAHLYYAGSVGSIKAGARMQMDQEGIVTLTQDGQTTNADLPFYLENTPGVVLSEDMLYYTPRSGQCRRALHFSSITCTDAGVTVNRDGKATRTDRGFLFDGDNIYVFLEPMVVQFNNYTMELPALSYVEAEYGGYMMVFNYETKQCFMELSDGRATATPAGGDYEVSLMGDALVNMDGERELLISVPSLVDPIA